MRSSKTAGLVLALMLGAASAGLAQQPSNEHKDTTRQGRQEWQGRRHGGGFGMLLKGIELTDQQKTQLKALHEKRGDDREQGQRGELRDEVKTARERGDTAKLREFRQQQFTRMQQNREEITRQVRAILTPAQQQVFDRNVADAKDRFEKRAERGKRFDQQRRS
jgi:Spy/CpxP family protein refolding chaperone